MRSHVAALPLLEGEPAIDRKLRRFMGEVSVYAHHALRNALADARLPTEALSQATTGLLVGSGVGSLSRYVEALDLLRQSGLRKVPPYVVPQTMASTASACLATAYGVGGVSYTISAACASAAHAIGQGVELIRSGRQHVVLAGGAEEAGWESAAMFDAMGALSSAYNDTPERASRPYDTGRDGFVMAGGAAMLVLEDLQRARERGARCYAEVSGYGAASGGEMVSISVPAAVRAMRGALADAGANGVDYVKTHAIASEAGDTAELEALRIVFGAEVPPLSSTKGLTGHSLGASGAQDAVYALVMMHEGFLAPCVNMEHPDPACGGLPLITQPTARRVGRVLSNSFGFGGSYASLVFARLA
jgi:3-oxoacyl-[acyl-carrier-protein] synthase I